MASNIFANGKLGPPRIPANEFKYLVIDGRP